MPHPFTGGTIDAYLAEHGVKTEGTQTPGSGGTNYFSYLDGHALTEGELANSNLVLDAGGFAYVPTFGEEFVDGVLQSVVTGFELAPKWVMDEILGKGGAAGGARGPTAAELAIQRSQVQAQNLSTFIQGTIAELSAEIDAGRLKTDQALGEFNKRLDAFSEAGDQFIGIQPFTIAPGAKFFPGRGPGGIGEQLGQPVVKASPIDFDPFQMAQDIVDQSPNLTDIGVPSGTALDEAIAIAKGFL